MGQRQTTRSKEWSKLERKGEGSTKADYYVFDWSIRFDTQTHTGLAATCIVCGAHWNWPLLVRYWSDTDRPTDPAVSFGRSVYGRYNGLVKHGAYTDRSLSRPLTLAADTNANKQMSCVPPHLGSELLGLVIVLDVVVAMSYRHQPSSRQA